jgi:Condensation domain
MNASPMLPLSLSQREILYPKANTYSAIRFKGKLCTPVLCRALGFITRRHEGLRMRVSGSKEQQYFVDPIDSYELNVVPAENLSAVEERIRTWLQRPADLENKGPFQAELLRLEESDHVLVLIIHAIVADNYLSGLLIGELLVAYDSHARDKEPALPTAMRYSDYVRNEVRCGKTLNDSQLKYWRSVLTGSRDPIPNREDYSALSVGTSRVMTASLTAAETERLQEFSSAANVSMTVALYAVTLLSISSQFGADDFLAKVACSGKDSRLLETLGSRTSRVFPLRIIVNNSMPLSQFARNVQSAFLCGTLASRAPFTLGRIDEQVFRETRAQSGPGKKPAIQQRLNLSVADHTMLQRDLTMATPRLSAERVFLDPRAFEMKDIDLQEMREELPFEDGALRISLRRDLAREAGRPVSFVAGFFTHAFKEVEINQLLDRMCRIARMAQRDNQSVPIGDIISQSLSSQSSDCSPRYHLPQVTKEGTA